MNQWRNTQEVIHWFNEIQDKTDKYFIKFDIVSFYPSITKTTLLKAIEFGNKYRPIDKTETEIIMNACRTVLKFDNATWMKKNNQDDFDVPMGSFHGAELCELVGLYLLYKINKIFSEDGDCGIYRDDGLAVTKKCAGTILERMGKKLRTTCLNEGFKITLESGLLKTEFLDVMFDLGNDTYGPYRKENSAINYVDNRSNHPRYILNQIPITINERLNGLSKSRHEFEKNRGIYESALKRSQYDPKLAYKEKGKEKRKRRRKIIFFQPPFCRTVSSDICEGLMKLLKKHFPMGHKYEKIFNKNKIRVSYSCMPNVKSLITAHNGRVMNAYNSDRIVGKKSCNCRKKESCPVKQNCQVDNIIYRATVKSSEGTKTYVGSSGNTFKERYLGHKSSFNHKNGSNKTELAKYIWKLKANNIKYDLTWDIINKTRKKFTRKYGCTLCNLEKIAIWNADKSNSLNKRKELQTKCPHYRNMFLGKIPDETVK